MNQRCPEELRKLILENDITLDGVVESNGSWRFAYASNDLAAYDIQKITSWEAMLLGRTTYQMFADYWPKQKNNAYRIADKLNSIRKIVVSSTLKSADWNNTTIISKEVEEEIRKLKSGSGGDIGIYGITLAQWLMQHDLIDEYHLLVFPLVLGNGRKLYKDGINIPLELIESRALSRGVILSRYRPAKEPSSPSEHVRVK